VQDERSVAECVIGRNTMCRRMASAKRVWGGCNDRRLAMRRCGRGDRRSSDGAARDRGHAQRREGEEKRKQRTETRPARVKGSPTGQARGRGGDKNGKHGRLEVAGAALHVFAVAHGLGQGLTWGESRRGLG
jgi:hypothetical protein